MFYRTDTGRLIRENADGTREEYRDGLNGWKPCMLWPGEKLEELSLRDFEKLKLDIDRMT